MTIISTCLKPFIFTIDVLFGLNMLTPDNRWKKIKKCKERKKDVAMPELFVTSAQNKIQVFIS